MRDRSWKGPQGQRIALIDGLRGIAAVAVVLYHFNNRLELRSVLGVIVGNCNLGVALFFVLSGFVITLSLGDRLISFPYLGRFALRRSLRLDPPYLCTIAAMILLASYGSAFGAHAVVPTWSTLIAHVFYLQDVLHLPPILSIFWSLCLEVQFYLVVALMLLALQRGKTASHRVGQPYYQLIFLSGIVASLVCRHYNIGPTTFAYFWFCFALGVMAFWAHAGWVRRGYAYTAIAIVLVYGAIYHDLWADISALASLSILAASVSGRLNLLSHPITQFLGRISYSLYLTHLIFGWYALSIAMRYTSKPVAFLIGMTVGVASAWAWYRLIEQPSVRLSHWVTQKAPQDNSLQALPAT